MRILITNDDGIHGPGLEVLERIAAQLSDDVFTVDLLQKTYGGRLTLLSDVARKAERERATSRARLFVKAMSPPLAAA